MDRHLWAMDTHHRRSTRLRSVLLVSVALAGLAVGAPIQGAAQTPVDTTRVVEVTLVDGSTVRGRILSDGDPLRIRLARGDVLEVARARVRSVTEAEGALVEGEYWPEDPNRTSLFVGPTARTLERGRGYLGVYELFFPLAGVGLSDHVTLAAGAPILGDLLEEGLFYIAPKIRFPGTGPNLDVAVGGLAFLAGDDHLGVLYGVMTAGNRDRSVTVAALVPWYDREWGDQPFVMVGFEARTSKSIKLMSENYISADAVLVTFGPRFFSERLSADVGVAVAGEGGFETIFPIVNFMYSW